MSQQFGSYRTRGVSLWIKCRLIKKGFVTSQDVSLDKEYIEWIHELKSRFRNSQIKAAVKVNSEQLLFNWQLGRDLVVRKAEEKWGTGIVNQVSLDLQAEFPEAKGFSARNLWNMKKWYLFYAENDGVSDILQTFNSLINTESEKLQQVAAEIHEKPDRQKLKQVVAEIPFPAGFSFVPWGHHCLIITKCKKVEEALYYLRRTIEIGLSRSALDDCIRADLYHTSGAAVTNFAEKLPPIQGALAKEILKSNYDFGFVSPPDVLKNRINVVVVHLGRL